jgi:hypothetical protein
MVLLETGNWKLTTPSDSLLHTACVNHRPWRARWICPPSLSRAPADFVVGKNYRLQDIQLSKIIRGKYRPSELTVARGAFPRTPFAHSLAGPQSPAPFVRVCRWNHWERCRSTKLPILLMPLARRKQDRKNFLSASPPSRSGGQPSISSPGGLPTVARFRSARWQPNGSRAEVGEYRARTGDLLVANQALSQLS